jgi:outer membrane lipoprotein
MISTDTLDFSPRQANNITMRKKQTYAFLVSMLCVALFSCAPVLDGAYMREGERDVSFKALRDNPDQHIGELFILGGVIVRTKFTEAGSQIEAMHVQVDRYGYFEDIGRSEGRFLALAPKENTLDPVVFRRGRRITLAGVFTGIRKGKIDEIEYAYPVFQIKQIYLWAREERVYPPGYYDPWFYPYPYPYYYRYPWWRYSYPPPRLAPMLAPTPAARPRPRKEQ